MQDRSAVRAPASIQLRWTRAEIALFVGIGVVSLSIVVLSGRISGAGVEEWDTPFFFRIQLPFAAIAAVFGGFMFPGHAWRWGLAPWWMQHVYMVWQHGLGNIWPIALVFWVVVLLPFVGLAALGGGMSSHIKRKASGRKG